MNTKTSVCRSCQRLIQFDGDVFRTRHYCDIPAPGQYSSTCRELNLQKKNRDKNARIRAQSAALDGGGRGRNNKDLTTRLRTLTIRSHSEVAEIMGLSAEAVRQIELRAFAKIRAALLPFKNATSGANKVRQIQTPISSLAD